MRALRLADQFTGGLLKVKCLSTVNVLIFQTVRPLKQMRPCAASRQQEM